MVDWGSWGVGLTFVMVSSIWSSGCIDVRRSKLRDLKLKPSLRPQGRISQSLTLIKARYCKVRIMASTSLPSSFFHIPFIVYFSSYLLLGRW